MDVGKDIGDWQCIKILGRGSFGVVGLWKNLKSGQHYAIKKFQVRILSSQHQQPSEEVLAERERLWRKEVVIMSDVSDCPYIVAPNPVPGDLAAFFTVPPKNLPLLCLEYCSGGDLLGILRRPENLCGFRENQVHRVLSDVLEAITYLHDKNIIHRDLKPSNVLVCNGPFNKITYKLSDLGFAKDLPSSDDLCSAILGTAQYLAPEIYLKKKYDKTVDYWSFGLIAFEIMCGRRPFLHGEPQGKWLNLLEKKANDVISIYRTGDGKIEYSTVFPFHSHCSENFKKCMAVWFATMLQTDPTLRGRKVTVVEGTMPITTASSEGQGPLIGLQLLKNILEMKFLNIHNAAKKLSFAVRSKTKISHVQDWIFESTGLAAENQLILTIDGVEIKKTDEAAGFVESTDLYLVPRQPEDLRLKIKMPVHVNEFLSEWSTCKDPQKLRMVWSSAIYFVQAESLKVETVKKSSEALRAWCNSCYTNRLTSLRNGIERSAASLEKLLELERKLEEIENDAASKTGKETSGARFWTQEMNSLQNFYSSCLDDWVENIVLKPVRTTELEESYDKIINACGDWKTADSSSLACSFNQTLVRSICQFILQRDEIADAFVHNIKIQLTKVHSDAKLIENMASVIIKLDQIIATIIKLRCDKHLELVRKSSAGISIPSVCAEHEDKENSTDYATVTPKSSNSNPYSIRGGGIQCKHPWQMSQSYTSGSRSSPKRGRVMACSHNSAITRWTPSPPIDHILEKSQTLLSQMQGTRKSLRDSVEEMNLLMKSSTMSLTEEDN